MANDKDPLLGALGICRKAGKLLHGYDRVEEAVMRGKACLVLLACDASKRTTQQHMQDTCRGVIPCAVMPLKGEDLRMLTPKPAAVFAVTDENLAHLCAGYLKKASEGGFSQWLISNTKLRILQKILASAPKKVIETFAELTGETRKTGATFEENEVNALLEALTRETAVKDLG